MKMKCIISCMKRVTSPGSMHDAGCLGLVHWDDPEGWYGKGGDRGNLVEKKESPKRERAVKPVISLPSKNGY